MNNKSSTLLLILLVMLLCVMTSSIITAATSETKYEIVVTRGQDQTVAANAQFKDKISIKVWDKSINQAAPIDLPVYFFAEPGNRLKPYFKDSMLRTKSGGIISDVSVQSGFSVGKGSAIISLSDLKSFNKDSSVHTRLNFTVTSVVYVQAWIQIALVLFFSVVSIVGSFMLAAFVLAKNAGTKEMRNVADPIKEGAQGFLRTQYVTITALAIPLAFCLFLMYYLRAASATDPKISQMWVALIVAFSFLLGAFFSGLSGFIGMFVSVRANIRVTSAATRSYNEALTIATFSGAFAGFLVVALSVLGVIVLFAVLYAAMPPASVDPQQIVAMIVGFSFGCSLSALFAQLGGGIFTKAADVGADLVGKVESNIPEDDIRNPAVIADLVGDNVGDCAGRGSDLFESISAENIGVMILAGSLCANASPQISSPISYIIFPLIVHLCGMVGSWIGIFFVRVRDVSDIRARKNEDEFSLLSVQHDDNEDSNADHSDQSEHSDVAPERSDLKLQDLDDPMVALNFGYAISSLITTVLFVGVCAWLLYSPQFPSAWFYYALCGIIGILTSWAFVFITVYYTDYKWYPVRSIVEASKTGAATNIISGIAVGLESTAAPVIVISIAILSSFYLGRASGIVNENNERIGGLFGIAVATIGMLSTSSFILTMDTLGPIVDNAGGIAEMSGLPADIRLVTDRLDAVGNTTKALTKGYAIGSASLAAFLLFTAFLDTVTSYIGKPFTVVNLATPEVFVGGLCGAALVFLFSALTIRAVGKSAQTVIEEVRRQFRENPGIMDYSCKPDYERCVAIVTRSALIQMIAPGLLAVFVPVCVGFIFKEVGRWDGNPYLGAEVSAGFLMVATIAGILLALFLNNSGGSWDNAKKLAEMDASIGGKGSDVHKATVIGDTIGDPFKDTAGPSLHVLIKLLATITLVIGPMYLGN